MKLPRKGLPVPKPQSETTVVAKPPPTARRQYDPRDGSPPFWETYGTVFLRHGTKDGYWEAVIVDRTSKKTTRAIVTVRDGGFAGAYKRRRRTKLEDLPF